MPVGAQQEVLVSNEQSKEQQNTQKDTKQQSPEPGTSNNRLFGLPDFLTIRNRQQLPPLTSAEKFKVVVRESFDYTVYPWFGFQAALSQAVNSEAGYGQGAAGYAKRYGAAFADGTIDNFMTGAVFPSLLKQDPRYYRMGSGGFWRRTGYAISRTFVTRGDSGNTQCNFSEIMGSGAAASISTYSYHPRADRNGPNTLSVWGTSVGYDSMTNFFKEFWPDIQDLIHKTIHRHSDPR